MSGSEGSSTKQSTSRVSQGRLNGALEKGNVLKTVTTTNARIPNKNREESNGEESHVLSFFLHLNRQ